MMQNLKDKQRPKAQPRTTRKVPVPLKTPEAPGEKGTGADSAEASRRSETILLVEDESSVRRTLASFLKANGYNVLEADDGPGALEVAEQRKGPVHLVLTDLIMPQMSAGELVRRLKAFRPGIKVIYMSGRLSEDQLLDPSKPFLRKPFRLEDLERKVRQVLATTEDR